MRVHVPLMLFKYLQRATAYNEELATAYYGIACIYSLRGKKQLALQFLEKSLQGGFKDLHHIEKNSDMNALRNECGWKRLMERYS